MLVQANPFRSFGNAIFEVNIRLRPVRSEFSETECSSAAQQIRKIGTTRDLRLAAAEDSRAPIEKRRALMIPRFKPEIRSSAGEDARAQANLISD